MRLKPSLLKLCLADSRRLVAFLLNPAFTSSRSVRSALFSIGFRFVFIVLSPVPRDGEIVYVWAWIIVQLGKGQAGPGFHFDLVVIHREKRFRRGVQQGPKEKTLSCDIHRLYALLRSLTHQGFPLFQSPDNWRSMNLSWNHTGTFCRRLRFQTECRQQYVLWLWWGLSC